MLPRVYLVVCLCFNEKLLEKENIAHEVYLENEILREEYYKKLKSLKQLYKSGKLLLNQNTIERLMKYLDEDTIVQVSGVAERPDPEVEERKKKRYQRVRIDKAVSEGIKGKITKEKYN